MIKKLWLAALAAVVLAPAAHAQWAYRYPKLDDFGHQIYLEQHELPALGYGPTDPAPSPDGTSLAFAAQGWIWLLDFESGVAKRLTTAAGVDARPRWSPNGRQLTFIRDIGKRRHGQRTLAVALPHILQLDQQDNPSIHRQFSMISTSTDCFQGRRSRGVHHSDGPLLGRHRSGPNPPDKHRRRQDARLAK